MLKSYTYIEYHPKDFHIPRCFFLFYGGKVTKKSLHLHILLILNYIKIDYGQIYK